MSGRTIKYEKVFINGTEVEGVAKIETGRKSKTLVRIDLRTLRPNPEAGSEVTYINVGQVVEFKFIHAEPRLPAMVSRDRRFRNVSIERNDPAWTHVYRFTGKATVALFNKLKRVFGEGKVNLTVNNLYRAAHHPPLAPYLFEYLNPEVRCRNCGKRSRVNDLINETDYDFGGNPVGIENGCPRCEIGGCADIMYETPEQALKRKGS